MRIQEIFEPVIVLGFGDGSPCYFVFLHSRVFKTLWGVLFLVKTHAGSGTGSMTLFGISQGGFHPQLEPIVITSNFRSIGRVFHFWWGDKLGRSTKYSGRGAKVLSSWIGGPQTTFP